MIIILIRKWAAFFRYENWFVIENGQAYGTMMCGKKDGHIDMTAHISP